MRCLKRSDFGQILAIETRALATLTISTRSNMTRSCLDQGLYELNRINVDG